MARAEFNGVTFEFPDGTSDDDMAGAIQGYIEETPAAAVLRRWEPDVSPQTRAQLMGTTEFKWDGSEEIGLSGNEEQFVSHIRTIETGGLEDGYIRTKVKGSGSSAYGPYQITRGLLRGTIASNPNLFDENELAAMNALIERQSVALAVGGSDRKRYAKGGAKAAQGALWAKQYGYESVDQFLADFDYGGNLGLGDNPEFQYLYENVARKLLRQHLKDAGGDFIEAASVWHGGTNWKRAGSKADTIAYRAKMQKLMG